MTDDRLRSLAATASLSLACLLSLLKLAAALATGSLAILTSLIDSLGDIVASGITFFSVRISQQPPDRRHRFGHGKAESLSALAQAAVVLGSALFVVIQAVQRLFQPAALRAHEVGIGVMVTAVLLTLALVIFQRRVVQRTGSPAIEADSLHYKADLITNLAVMASIWLATHGGLSWADPVIALAIAAYLLWHAARIGHNAIDVLMDHELDPARRERIKAIVLSHPEVEGLHDLRTREAGTKQFIELHAEIDGEMTIHAAHRVTDAIEEELCAAFPDAEVIIHQEPAGIDDARLDHVIAQNSRSGR